jgi:hypothetical protein
MQREGQREEGQRKKMLKMALVAGQQMSAFVSSHPLLPTNFELEFERVLCPFVLDNVNRYAGCEYTDVKTVDAPELLVKGFAERGHSQVVRSTVRGTLHRLLMPFTDSNSDGGGHVEGTGGAGSDGVGGDDASGVQRALVFAKHSIERLLGGECPIDELVMGAYLWRQNQEDLSRMASITGVGSGGGGSSGSSGKLLKADVDGLKTSHVALAVRTLQRRPWRRFRLGEWVPYVITTSSDVGATQCASAVDPLMWR